jgi:acyl carrier protein
MIAERVVAIIARTAKIPAERISLESTFEELGIDSLDGVELVFEIENEFNINVPNENAREMKSVRRVVEGIEALLAQDAAAAGGPRAAPSSAEG